MIHWTLSCYTRPCDLLYSYVAGKQCGGDRRSHENNNMVSVCNTIAFIKHIFCEFVFLRLYNELDYIGCAFWCCFVFQCALDSVVVQCCMNGVAGNTKTPSLFHLHMCKYANVEKLRTELNVMENHLQYEEFIENWWMVRSSILEKQL